MSESLNLACFEKFFVYLWPEILFINLKKSSGSAQQSYTKAPMHLVMLAGLNWDVTGFVTGPYIGTGRFNLCLCYTPMLWCGDNCGTELRTWLS